MSDSAILDDISGDNLSINDTPSPDADADGFNDLASCTPDNSNSAGSNSGNGSSSSASRRPPRKSTLTQQQKNQKRQRATQEQLVTLEHEFAKNSTPTAATRERIASEIQMTERSVQIWFQNSRRRAKIKMMAKKGLDTGDDLDRMPMHIAMAMGMDGRPMPPHLMARHGQPTSYASGNMFMGADLNNSGKVVIHHFTCRSLSIGSWRRVGQNAMDLVVFYSPDKACITYYINNDSAGYKIEFPFAFIKDITLESGESQPGPNGAPPRSGGLVIQLTRPPNFFMDSSGQGGFYQCGDFTEDQQASHVLTHHLGGHPKVLSGQLAKLVSLESYQNRHSPFDLHAMPASAPVSPSMGIPRPASQPNVHFARPYPPNAGMFDQGFPGHVGLHPGRMNHGHKRQRSRSVPAAIDFSMLHGPMPTFNIQQPSPQEFHHQPHFFHPMPQHPGQMQLMGSNLQIDTSAGYGMDMRQMPMSATTTTPSEFASPGFFPSHPHHPQMSQPAQDFKPDFNNALNGPFLSPSPMGDHSHMIPQSHTPLSHMSHHEPHIANNSPPLGTHRSASADMFSMDQSHNLNDESLMLSEMYSKQNLNMPMPSPAFDENGMLTMHDMPDFHTPREHMDLNMVPFEPREHMDLNMVPYSTIDPNALGVSH